MRPFRQWAQGHYAPIILVVSTPAAEALCQKSGLSVVDIFRPFSVTNPNVPIRTSETPYRLREFNVRFATPEHCVQPSPEVADERVNNALAPWSSPSDTANDYAATAAGDTGGENLLARMLTPDGCPWYDAFREEFWRTLCFGDYEAFDHPVACFIIGTSNAEDPVRTFTDLARPSLLPPILRSGIADPAILRHFVVLHDATHPTAQADSVRNALRGAFGPGSASVLTLNSRGIPGCSEAPLPDVWCGRAGAQRADVGPLIKAAEISARDTTQRNVLRASESFGSTSGHAEFSSPARPVRPPLTPPLTEGSTAEASASGSAQVNGDHPLADGSAFRHPLEEDGPGVPPEPPARGLLMTEGDHAGIKSFVEEFVAKVMLPFMEQKVVNISTTVAAGKKGLRNTIKSLWRGKESRGEGLRPDGAYGYGMPEAQLRLSADLAFMLRDYELALSHWRLCVSDFKTDRAVRQLGAAHESCGLAMAMLDVPRREIESAFEAAWAAYRTLPPPLGQRLATRSQVLCAAALDAAGALREATVPLTRASYDEANIRAALLLEQAALFYARASPPRRRKSAFHLVLAGHRYNLAGSRVHAARAYAAALPEFHGKQWRYIEEHLYFALGRQTAHSGDMVSAARFFARLLSVVPPGATAQAAYLREFLYVVQCAGSLLESNRLELPVPLIDTGRVDVRFDDHRAFASPAARQVPETQWQAMESAAGLLPSDIASTASAMLNWMDRAASVAKMSLSQKKQLVEQQSICVAEEEVGVMVHLRNPLTIAVDVSGIKLVGTFVPDGTLKQPVALTDLAAREEAIQLDPGERTRIRVFTSPPGPGTMRITGVEWRLGGSAPGQCTFDVRAPKTRRNEHTGTWARNVPPSGRLLFRVTNTMPRLQASIEGLPETCPLGALLPCKLRLENVGNAPLSTLRLAISTPLVMPALSLEGKGRSDAVSAAMVEPGAAFPLPQGSNGLKPGETLEWPMWVHAADPEQLEPFYMSIFYTPEVVSGSMRYRVLRLACSLSVRSGLHISAAVTLSPAAADRKIIRLNVENHHMAHRFQLSQLDVVEDRWRIVPLGIPAPELGPGESCALFVALTPVHAGASAMTPTGLLLYGSADGASRAIARGSLGPLLLSRTHGERASGPGAMAGPGAGMRTMSSSGHGSSHIARSTSMGSFQAGGPQGQRGGGGPTMHATPVERTHPLEPLQLSVMWQMSGPPTDGGAGGAHAHANAHGHGHAHGGVEEEAGGEDDGMAPSGIREWASTGHLGQRLASAAQAPHPPIKAPSHGATQSSPSRSPLAAVSGSGQLGTIFVARGVSGVSVAVDPDSPLPALVRGVLRGHATTLQHDFARGAAVCNLIAEVHNAGLETVEVTVELSSPPMGGWESASPSAAHPEIRGEPLGVPSTPGCMWVGPLRTTRRVEAEQSIEIPVSVALFAAGAHDLTPLWKLSWGPPRPSKAAAEQGSTAGADGASAGDCASGTVGSGAGSSAAVTRALSQLSVASGAVSDTGTGGEGSASQPFSSEAQQEVQSANPPFILLVNHQVSELAARRMADGTWGLGLGYGGADSSPTASPFGGKLRRSLLQDGQGSSRAGAPASAGAAAASAALDGLFASPLGSSDPAVP